ncbi:hypothetical protein BH10BAC5_BH10BAC5_09270 [soil metagenome]
MKNFIIIFLLAGFTSPVFSQWSTDPSVNNKISPSSSYNNWSENSCPDGAGGIIVIWNKVYFANSELYAQRISYSGYPMWTPGGVLIGVGPQTTSIPNVLCTDGGGGAIVYWNDLRSGVYSVYAQRLRSDGQLMWAPGGVQVSPSNPSFVFSLKCIPAEAGSSIVVWSSNLPIPNLSTQKMNWDGTKAWTSDVMLATNSNSFDLCEDGGKGAYYTWSEGPFTTSDIFAQHVNALGTIQWTPRKTVCNVAEDQFLPTMCTDQNGGFIVAWGDSRDFIFSSGTNSDIYAAHFNSAGNNLWTPNGTPICTDTNQQLIMNCISDLHGGAHIFWIDLGELMISGNIRIYGQNITHNGNTRWTYNGKKIADSIDFNATQDGRSNPSISAVDNQGGAIVCWMGLRDGVNFGILAQKVDYYSNILWDPKGVFISTGMLKRRPIATFDGGYGGCNFVWVDYRNVIANIYGQHIKSDATLGRPKPVNSGTQEAYTIRQNFPNPFNPTTNIAFTLTNDANVSITVFDMSGRQLEVLADGFLTAGDHSVTWNAANNASGTYFYKFTIGNKSEIKKMLLIK